MEEARSLAWFLRRKAFTATEERTLSGTVIALCGLGRDHEDDHKHEYEHGRGRARVSRSEDAVGIGIDLQVNMPCGRGPRERGLCAAGEGIQPFGAARQDGEVPAILPLDAMHDRR